MKAYLKKVIVFELADYLYNTFKSEAIDTDQSVALMVTKVTIDTDRWQVCNGNVY